jgi:hypothetical protein
MTRTFWIASALMCWATSSFALNIETPKNRKKSDFIYDWSALGSGCKGGLEKRNGNVSLALKSNIPPGVNRYQLRFVLEKFKLESPVPKSQGRTNLKFARDCAIRVAVNPPAGKKIQNVEAYTAYSLTKPRNTEMQAMTGLSIGMSTLSTVAMDFQKDETFSNLIREVRLAPGQSPEDKMPETKCGQSKLVGLDLLLLVNRPDDSVVVDMTLADNKVVDIIVDLEDCE